MMHKRAIWTVTFCCAACSSPALDTASTPEDVETGGEDAGRGGAGGRADAMETGGTAHADAAREAAPSSASAGSGGGGGGCTTVFYDGQRINLASGRTSFYGSGTVKEANASPPPSGHNYLDIKLNYPASKVTGMYWYPGPTYDLSKVGAMQYFIRASSGTNSDLSMEMDTPGNIGTKWVKVSDHIDGSSITTDWKQATIPLSAFDDAANLPTISSVTWWIWSATAGTVEFYISDAQWVCP